MTNFILSGQSDAISSLMKLYAYPCASTNQQSEFYPLLPENMYDEAKALR